MSEVPLLTTDVVSPSFSPQQQQQQQQQRGTRPSQIPAAMDNRHLTKWNSDLCDCCDDMRSCCFGFFLCPCAACALSKRLGHPRCLPMCDIFTHLSIVICGLPMCPTPALLATRVEFRKRYAIEGTLYDDIIASWCCVGCAWCQMTREFKYRKENPTNVIYMQPPPQPGPVMEPCPEPVRPVGFTVASY